MNITINMTSGLRTLILATAFSCATVAAAPAQDVQAELQAIRKLVEQQNDQLARLTAEVARLAALVDGPKRGPANGAPSTAEAPTPAPGSAPAAEPVRPPVVPPPNVHVVVKGDSLDKIAKQHGVTIAELQKLNKISDPKKLQIGQTLVLPPNATPATPPASATPPAPAVPATPNVPEKKETQ
jgi:LysM repeat protein